MDGWAARPGEESTAEVTGAWFDGSGFFRAGALGVFIDIALGAPGMTNRPSPAHGMVTAELAIDVAGPPLAAGDRVRGPSELVALSSGGVLVRGSVLDERTGGIVAVAHMTQRFVPSGAVGDLRRIGTVDGGGRFSVSMPEVFGLAPDRPGGGMNFRIQVEEWLLNPRRTLHGGIITALSEYAASMSFGEDRDRWRCGSIRVNFLRPITGGASAVVGVRALHFGRTTAVVDTWLDDANARRAAVARVTFSRAGT